jgi:hypothetical protein
MPLLPAETRPGQLTPIGAPHRELVRQGTQRGKKRGQEEKRGKKGTRTDYSSCRSLFRVKPCKKRGTHLSIRSDCQASRLVHARRPG